MQLVAGKGPKAAHDSLRQLKANCPAERSQSKEDAPLDYNSRAWMALKNWEQRTEDEANDGTDVSAFVGRLGG